MKIDYNKRIFGLDLMRAVAILCVVFSHALWIYPAATGPLKDLLSLMGVLGVEIFFVLSGFLIGGILYKSMVLNVPTKKTITHFWMRRWFRTLPNYYLILLVNIGIVLYIGRDLPDSLWKYFFFLQNFASEMNIFFTESWSLPIEEFAYLLGPILLISLLIFFKKSTQKRLFLLATSLILMAFLLTKVYYHFYLSSPDMYYWNENLKTVTIYRLDAIFYGFLGVYMAQNFSTIWRRYAVLFAGLGALILLLLNFGVPYLGWFIDYKPMFWNVWYLPINSVAILCFVPWLSGWKSSNRLLRFGVTRLSHISYSMYLLHYSVILQLMQYFLPIQELSQLDKVVYVIAYLLLTTILSYLLFNVFERPMTNLRDNPLVMKWFGLKFKK